MINALIAQFFLDNWVYISLSAVVIIILIVVFLVTEPGLVKKRKKAASKMIAEGQIKDFALFNRCFDTLEKRKMHDSEAAKLFEQLKELKNKSTSKERKPI
jgi:hypothetical protein